MKKVRLPRKTKKKYIAMAGVYAYETNKMFVRLGLFERFNLDPVKLPDSYSPKEAIA